MLDELLHTRVEPEKRTAMGCAGEIALRAFLVLSNRIRRLRQVCSPPAPKPRRIVLIARRSDLDDRLISEPNQPATFISVVSSVKTAPVQKVST